MRKIRRLLFLSILFYSFAGSGGATTSEPQQAFSQLDVPAHSDAEPDQYLNYTFVEGDSLKSVLRRLRLFPIWGSKGSYNHFLKLNPKWPKNQRAELPAPVGRRVRLPIDKAPIPQSQGRDQWVVKVGELFFINPKLSDKTDLYTKIFNLQNLNGESAEKSGRQVASLNSSPTGNQSTVIKVPVRPGSDLGRRLSMLGIEVPPLQKDQPYAFVEIPLQYWQNVVNGRDVASLSEVRMSDPTKSRFRLNAQAVAASRLYSIGDSNGESGNIGVDPSLGADLGFSYKATSWWQLEANVNFQMETFKPDFSIRINQETDYRLQTSLVSYFSVLDLEVGVGGGLLSTPSFVSTSATELQAKHLNNPYATLAIRDTIPVSDSWMAGWMIAYDQLFGIADGPYKLESGFRVTGGAFSKFRLTRGTNFTGSMQVYHQDDKPATYEQTQLGFQLLLGLEWNFGNSEGQ